MNIWHIDDIPEDLKGYFQPVGQIGLEKTPEEYVQKLVEVFREVRRALHPSGTLWLNLGDSYFTNWGSLRAEGGGGLKDVPRERRKDGASKAKQLVGIPWKVAFALQEDGWWLRSDIIWAKGACMPEAVKDRPTRSHEYIFLLAKSQRYFYDQDAIREPQAKESYDYTPGKSTEERKAQGHPSRYGLESAKGLGLGSIPPPEAGRNKRSVWHINPTPYPEAHFATFPPTLPEICIRAGTSEKGCCPTCKAQWDHEGDDWKPTCKCPEHEPEPCTVLDPFAGSGTTLAVALSLGRSCIGIELNENYRQLIEERIRIPDETNAQKAMFDLAMED